MSFEIYIQCFRGGEPAGLPRDAVRSLFPVVEAKSSDDHWRVRYDDLNSCDIDVSALPADEGLITDMTVERPCGDMRLFDSLFAVMQLGPVVCYFPADSPPLVANPSTTAELPPDMVEALGTPQCVRSGEEFHAAIRGA